MRKFDFIFVHVDGRQKRHQIRASSLAEARKRIRWLRRKLEKDRFGAYGAQFSDVWIRL